ncbi:MAG: hypothetical protein IIU35_01210, partial [Neisseriaceae bacterium]|nr:hypothetical protein [Neisseriaceae bacterium]
KAKGADEAKSPSTDIVWRPSARGAGADRSAADRGGDPRARRPRRRRTPVRRDPRQDFDEFYLRDIRFICLAMTNHFIDTHFDEIQQHACDIEQRLQSACDIGALKEDNYKYIQGFSKENIVLIDEHYQQTIDAVVEKIVQAA